MCPYFKEEDIPKPYCEGSYSEDWEWEGRIEDCPDTVICPVCGSKLTPDREQYEVGEKRGLWYAYIPNHDSGKSTS